MPLNCEGCEKGEVLDNQHFHRKKLGGDGILIITMTCRIFTDNKCKCEPRHAA